MSRLRNQKKRWMSKAAALVAAGAGVMGMVSSTSAAIFVRPVTWFNPSGTSSAPYSNFIAVECHALAGSTVTVRQGSFPDKPTFVRPMTYTTQGGETATIGVNPVSVTPLKIFTFNLHLFGDVVPFTPVWEDGNRALAIGIYGSFLKVNGVDIVGFQEAWDSDLWDSIRGVAAYPFAGYGGRRDSGSLQNSGLAIMSLHPISGGAQISYDDENGLDAGASKGFLKQTIVKNGITIGLWVTHTQSGDGSSDADTRQKQMNQLAVDVQVFRTLNPSSPVFVMGDFNVEGETLEYTINMSNAMGGIAGVADTTVNLGPCDGDALACTTCSNNDLREFFNGVKAGTRLDYVLYANSLNGTVRVIPRGYDVQRPLAASTFSGTGYAPENGGFKSMSSRQLSDHDAVYTEFELHKY